MQSTKKFHTFYNSYFSWVRKGPTLILDLSRDPIGQSQCLWSAALQRHHNERDGVSNHRRLVCLFNRLFRLTSKKTTKPTLLALCEGNPLVDSPLPVEFTHKGSVTRKPFPFGDFIMQFYRHNDRIKNPVLTFCTVFALGVVSSVSSVRPHDLPSQTTLQLQLDLLNYDHYDIYMN